MAGWSMSGWSTLSYTCIPYLFFPALGKYVKSILYKIPVHKLYLEEEMLFVKEDSIWKLGYHGAESFKAI